MGTVNVKRSPRVKAESHLNFMGGPGYFLSDPVRTLELAATSCFFGEPMYYHRDKKGKKPERLSDSDLKSLRSTLEALDPQEWRSLNPTQLMVKAIDDALDFNPERTLMFAKELRTLHHIRTTPQVILVRAAHHPKVRGTTLISTYGPGIVQRPDEPSVGLAYHIATYGKDKPIPNSLKRTWRKYLSTQNGYALAKYRMDDHQVKLVDVVNLVHAKSQGIDSIGRLMKGELKNTDTWESIISKSGSNKASWGKALEYMGHMALLRNLRNLSQAGVPYQSYLEKLVEGAADGKQLPFRYFSAYKAVGESTGPVKEAIEECMEQSMGALPKFAGRSMFLCDNSGSAWGQTTSSMGTMHVAEIANLTGVIGSHLSEEGYVGVFGDDLITTFISKKGSIFEQLEKLNDQKDEVGGSTEHGIWLFWDKAIKQSQHWDNVFVMSDMQAGHGGLYGVSGIPAIYRWNTRVSMQPYIDVGKLINAYRAKVNPKVNVFLIQVAGYHDTILPEFYKRTYILGGWSEGIFRFAAQMAGMMQGQ
jgi:hypothetical protein